jgi:hypothetical protein
MAKEKNTTEKTLQEAERNLQAIGNNPRKVGLAAFALRQIQRVDPREMNIVFTDKEFLKEKLEKIQEMDGIYLKLMSNVGKEGFLEDLKLFEEKIAAIQKTMDDLLNTFYEKGIGHNSAIKEWKKKQEKTEESAEATTEEAEAK